MEEAIQRCIYQQFYRNQLEYDRKIGLWNLRWWLVIQILVTQILCKLITKVYHDSSFSACNKHSAFVVNNKNG